MALCFSVYNYNFITFFQIIFTYLLRNPKGRFIFALSINHKLKQIIMNRLYIYDPTNFTGSALSTMPFVEKGSRYGTDILNSTYVDYTGLTFKEYNEKHGGNLVAITWDEFYPILDKYNKEAYCKEWKEITKDEYWELLECLPPCKWHDLNERFNSFYISEATTFDIHCFCVKDKKTEKYYSANRSCFISDEDLINELNQIK